MHGKSFTVFNAFLLPCDATNYDADIVNIGEAISDWKMNKKPYERVQGIVIDVKYLMKIYMHNDEAAIERLADCIEKTSKKGEKWIDG